MRLANVLLPTLAFYLAGCQIQAGRQEFALAERMSQEHKYEAAVATYDKVIENDPKSPLGQQSLFRAATINYLYLGNYAEAAKEYRRFTFLSQDARAVYEAEKNIGEIYFSKTEEYKKAIEQYQRLLGNYPDSQERDLFRFRIAKSYYQVLSFSEAIEQYRQLLKDFPKSALREETLYQIGNTYFTKGDYPAAHEAFEEVIIQFPSGRLKTFALFGVGNCFEEQDQLEEALRMYTKLREQYPNKEVIDLKIKRVRERFQRRNR